ncbi:pyridoxal-phosphate-dependent aminotransferase family protein [Inmirania thermothiophila]|uniref:Alanine-glyoxylate aminotransferase n=1 Tax=Inmirania thermothiophila TaxID=1750597 RepID=A0A3N1Y4X6_9GAMM|nr:alanine--glyoxylate aminotransferase family protein [Inmirania thermothiophila]ROR32682.1 alanine-glyoxylate aminotransferase [Inmirania thermothiophila]
MVATSAQTQASAVQAFRPPRRILMGPGPSDVHPRVLQAVAAPTIGHLDPDFVALMEEVKGLLRRTFRTGNILTFPVSGPGSVGMETCLVNLIEPGDTVVVCRNGVFGQRMEQIARRCGAEVVTVDAPWGRAVDPEALEAALARNPRASLVAFVHAETSTGAQSDAQALAEVAHRHDCLVVADTVTSLGGTPVEVDAWGLDAVYSGTQKCLSCVPGLSPVTFGERALERVRGRRTPVQSWFMDVGLVADYWAGEGRRTYHHTAPVNAVYALHEALRLLHEEGLERAWARHRLHHEALKAGLEALGLAFVVPEAERLPQLNAVRIPEGVDDAEVRTRMLREHGIEIGAGLGELAGRIWRIGLMGYGAREDNVLACLRALGQVLAELGRDVSAEAAVEAARACYLSAPRR